MSIEQQISTADKSIGVLREGWLDAKPEKKDKWMERINAALDERLKLMAVRDSAIVNPA